MFKLGSIECSAVARHVYMYLDTQYPAQLSVFLSSNQPTKFLTMVSFGFLLLFAVEMAVAAGTTTTLTNVPGFFAQDSPETDAAQFDYVYPTPSSTTTTRERLMETFLSRLRAILGCWIISRLRFLGRMRVYVMGVPLGESSRVPLRP
jgi:hypothetical protein